MEQARQASNAGDLDGYLRLYDESIALHGYGPQPFDKTTVVEFYRMIWAALAAEGRPIPGLQFHEVLEDGDLYSCRFTMVGVRQGDFMGVPATQRPYQLPGITVMRFGGHTSSNAGRVPNPRSSNSARRHPRSGVANGTAGPAADPAAGDPSRRSASG